MSGRRILTCDGSESEQVAIGEEARHDTEHHSGGPLEPHPASVPFSANIRKSMFATEDEFAAFIATLDEPLIIELNGRVAQDLAPYDFEP